MFSNVFRLTVLCGATILGGLQANHATAGATSVGTTPVFVPPIVTTPPGVQPGLNAGTTAAMVSSLNNATAFCSGLSAGEYVIDCLSEQLEAISRQYAGIEGYGDAQKAIADAAQQLHQIARDNRSSNKNKARFRSQNPDGPKTSRPLTPVDSANLSSAVTQALTVIQSTETLLLRSSETSIERSAQFQQIAEAVGSNKVLLRSL